LKAANLSQLADDNPANLQSLDARTSSVFSSRPPLMNDSASNQAHVEHNTAVHIGQKQTANSEANLVAPLGLAPGKFVCIHGLKARPDLNGKWGRLLEFDEREGRWKVVVDGTAGLMLREANLTLETNEFAHEESDHAHKPVEDAKSSLPMSLPMSTESQLGERAKAPQDADPSCEPSTAKSFVVGDWVHIRGLMSRSDLNGKKGQVVEFDEREQRWRVVVDGSTGLLVKSENLVRVTDDSTSQCAEQFPGMPHADKSAGSICSMEPEEAGLADQKGSLEAAHQSMSIPVLAAGKLVRIQGLTARPELNGKQGQLIKFDVEQDRWRVVVDGSTGLLLREANLNADVPCDRAEVEGGEPVQPTETGARPNISTTTQ